ncbi:MFS transporter [Burkholderia lata]|uniref:Major facilitator superfamily protein n=1 Tax=Burkholderia contaminans TaxID=488447 RepID=A0A6P2WTH3_9BURK|nr:MULTISPECIES: MFS transporter [Burkholderia cepacia complex]AOJ43219.1 MFS transporter [Burkholderia lata]VWD00036.1 major facilitator superfamily protein [Burkholderia contaminans]
MPPTLSTHPAAVDDGATQALYRRISRRLLPFLILCYTLSFIDRINIGFAHAQMAAELHFSDAVYGLGAGIFFIGYMAFEIPSNAWLARTGARRTIARIMVLWGLGSAATMFVTTPAQFYACRFLLGVFEAGFFPGILFYLGAWYPPRQRAKAFALFMTALYLAGLIAGPVSGAILSYFDGVGGLRGWQWLFVVEGLPSSALGLVALRFLDDRPDDARWLSDADKAALRAAHAHAEADAPHTHAARPLLAHRDFWLLCAANFAIAAAGYALVFWMPVILHRGGLHGAMQIGLLSALPYLCGIAGMLAMGWRTGRRREWRKHGAVAMLACAAALAGLASTSGTSHLMIALCIAVATHAAALPAFWVLPGLALPKRSMAVAIAAITMTGAIGGFASPFLMGVLNTATGSMRGGLYFNAALLAAGAIALLGTLRERAAPRADVG